MQTNWKKVFTDKGSNTEQLFIGDKPAEPFCYIWPHKRYNLKAGAWFGRCGVELFIGTKKEVKKNCEHKIKTQQNAE